MLQFEFEPLLQLVDGAPFLARQIRQVEARRDLVREGESPRCMILMLEGWACCYKQQRDGRRQITSFLLPGDLGDAGLILGETDHSIGAINRVRYAEIDQETMDRLPGDRSRLARAAWRHALVTASINREWVVNVGRRNACQRLAHLICELVVRLRAAGRFGEHGCEWPLTQDDLADATGLTSVHVNRTLQQLRRDGLIDLQRRRLGVPDLAALMRVGLFTPNYLHLERQPA